MATPASGASSWLTLNGKAVIFAEDTENLDVQAMEYTLHYLRVTTNAPGPLEIFIDHDLLDTQVYGVWLWKPRTYAGLYELRVKANGYPDQITKIRVVPRYFTQILYRKMQDELSTIAAGLLFSLVSSVSERVESVKHFQDASPLQDYRQISIIMGKLGKVLSAIRREPYRVLASKSEQRDWHEVWQFNGESQAIGGDCIRVQRRGRSLTLPTVWQVPQTLLSYDVYENRLLKQFLRKQLVARITFIQEQAESEIKQRKVTLLYKEKNKFNDAADERQEIDALQRAVANCQQMKRRCLQWSGEMYLRSVQGEASGDKATQFLLKHPDYSRFYKLYLQFQRQLQISLDSKTYITELGMRKIPDLYEMWSVFEITRIAIDELKRNGYKSVSQQLFALKNNVFQLQVRKNEASIVLAKDDMQVKIIYEPVYPNRNVTAGEKLVTTNGRNLPQTPDMSIEMYRNNKPQAVCIFDAKYKRERGHDGYFYPLIEDTDKMRNYAGNIQYQRYDIRSRSYRTDKIVAAAYVLFPGNCVLEEEDGKIGGLPLRPEMLPDLQQEVRQKVNDILSDAGII